MNAVERREFIRLKKLYESYATVGPLGSTHNVIPVEKNSLRAMLNDTSDTSWSASWAKSSVYKTITPLNNRSRRRKPSIETETRIPNILLPGELCQNCARSKKNDMNSLIQLRESLQHYFKILNGSEVGVVTIVGFEDQIVAFYTVMISRRPERYFGTRLN